MTLDDRAMTRREMLAAAAALGAALAWPVRVVKASPLHPRERRDLFPQGVASGDPQPNSVLLWTRRPPVNDDVATTLRLEVATDPDFRRVASTATVRVSAESDWTCRVLAAGLHPASVYWYRFVDERGSASRVGRTITAPASDDARVVRFAFVSCQNVQQGGQQAYRRMIWEDERREVASPDARMDFVLHLGDFVYEMVWYPEDRPQGMYARRIRDIVRYPTGEKHADFHIPTTVDDYRAVYRAYLLDPDLQDARARWPFVCMWDNHEFSWRGWQSQQNFGSGVIPAQTRKVAAAQAWYEYQPARVGRAGAAGGGVLDRYVRPDVSDRPLTTFDEHGLGLDPSNLAAIESLTAYRAFRWGRNVELILTDNRSFCAESVLERPEAAPFTPKGFPYLESLEAVETLDAGRAANGGRPPATIRVGDADLPNPRRSAAPPSVLGTEQKVWFLGRLRDSTARWKLWGNSFAMLDLLVDCANIPPELGVAWPVSGPAILGGGDWSSYRHERREILSFVRRHAISGFVSIAGDRHSFQAGTVPDAPGDPRITPVAAEFVTGSVSAPSLFEAAEYNLPADHPLRALYCYEPPGGSNGARPAPRPAINTTLMHGVRTSVALQRTHDARAALAVRNDGLARHLSFVDISGHGYGFVHAYGDTLDVEFVAIPRPVERSTSPDGGPLVYRVLHRVRAWRPGEPPRIERVGLEGALPFLE